MKFVTRILFRIGLLNGRTLDGIIESLSKLDKELEAYEALADAKVAKLNAQRDQIDSAIRATDADSARAARVRNKVADLIA